VNWPAQWDEFLVNSPSAVRLNLFGSPTLRRVSGSPVTGRAVQRHRIALLSLLAAAADRAVSRDWLMGQLWPESSPDQARKLLNAAVYVLRKELGENAILSETDHLRLNAAIVDADVAQFETALQREEYERAVALYTAPFLDGFFLPDAPEFEHWIERERVRLAHARATALEALAEAAEARQDLQGAVDWWRRRVEQDPYDSRVALRLMRALASRGNPAGALQHAATHQRLVREEYDTNPSPDVVAFAERLRSEPAVRGEPTRRSASPAPYEVGVAAVPGAAAVPASSSGSLPPATRRRSPFLLYGLAALAMAAVLFGASRLWRTRGAAPLRAASEPSIAVLRFTSSDDDPADIALADGMTEELIGLLSRVNGIRVIGSTSVFSLRDEALDVRRIGDTLGVTHVLRGAVQRNGSRLRVRVRLVDARDRSTQWSETYDRELQDVFAVQDDIIKSAVQELGIRLAAPERPLRRQPTHNLVAYELYRRGSDPVLLRSDRTAMEASEYFRRAVALDSTYAAAWAGLGRTYARLAGAALPLHDRERYWALAHEASLKAVSLDDSLIEAHATLALIYLRSFDIAAAGRQLARAVELDPTGVPIYEYLVVFDLWTGRPADALAHAQRALKLDPLSPLAHATLANALIHNDRCDEALARLETLMELKPPLMRTAPLAALCYAKKQMWPQAIALLRPQAERGEPHALALLGYMLARAGQREEATDVQARLLAQRRLRGGAAYHLALLSAGLGNVDEAFSWIDRATADQSRSGVPGLTLSLILMGPLLDDLPRDARFERVQQRLGFQMDSH
jgi:TolB-like protein/DNA-binding SARP family transcriptional activator